MDIDIQQHLDLQTNNQVQIDQNVLNNNNNTLTVDNCNHIEANTIADTTPVSNSNDVGNTIDSIKPLDINNQDGTMASNSEQAKLDVIENSATIKNIEDCQKKEDSYKVNSQNNDTNSIAHNSNTNNINDNTNVNNNNNNINNSNSNTIKNDSKNNNEELLEGFKVEIESLESSLLENEYELSHLRLLQLIEKQGQNKLQYTNYMKDIEIQDLKESQQISRHQEILKINVSLNS
ncbi:hypothetical protein DICPUDRAFT_78430 [Dictyostelium purpureum]|uniref:Uncharacterized protein n=1 Tax=Dictyostelium purpureum TaxID=5786 RepID=F0ZJI9_DICPU|nr:uncharacterized protein DICPUDRAFT_78430 [Dictyostelium purpureum]EGC35929.1 hypothetical protein DICPUDRAFT_78430 [Dictyostelium purpureum]|eukprot:XP_003287583.1 hypothetical protein DICPUDRAFT_78430 [Dictyostelium purpureum]